MPYVRCKLELLTATEGRLVLWLLHRCRNRHICSAGSLRVYKASTYPALSDTHWREDTALRKWMIIAMRIHESFGNRIYQYICRAQCLRAGEGYLQDRYQREAILTPGNRRQGCIYMPLPRPGESVIQQATRLIDESCTTLHCAKTGR